jgi:hypothetical protein
MISRTPPIETATRPIDARTLPIDTRTLPIDTGTLPIDTLPSRDRSSACRKGAVPLLLCDPNRHRLPLLRHHVSNRRPNIVPIPQPARALMPRPSLSIWSIYAALVQSSARLRFEIVHHFFGSGFGLYDGVNVVRSRVRGQKRPSPMPADLPYRIHYRTTAGRVQQIRSLVHQSALVARTRRIGLNQAMSRNVVVPIHGTGFVAMQMRAIARERNQVRHAASFYPAPSRSRLGRGRAHMQSYKDTRDPF